MKKALIPIAVVVVILLFFVGSYASHKNQMVAKNETVKASWSQVDVVLQRRADLIPNLVSTVKGFATQEQTVFDDIARARSALLGASSPQGKIQANGQLDGALGRLLVLTENYPQLRSSEQLMRLQDELAGTENRIAVERRNYNDSLKDYNTYIDQFPNSIYAGFAGFQRNDTYFNATEASRMVPKVDFGARLRPARLLQRDEFLFGARRRALNESPIS